MKKIVRRIMTIVLFPFTIVTCPFFALGMWMDGDYTYPQALKYAFKYAFKEWVLH